MRYESPSVRPRFKPKWLLWYKRMSPACDISSFQLWCCYLLCSWWFQTATNISPLQELTALEAESSQVYLYRPKITLPQRDLLSLQRPLPYIHLAWLQIRRNSFPDIFVSEKWEEPWSVYKRYDPTWVNHGSREESQKSHYLFFNMCRNAVDITELAWLYKSRRLFGTKAFYVVIFPFPPSKICTNHCRRSISGLLRTPQRVLGIFFSKLIFIFTQRCDSFMRGNEWSLIPSLKRV